MNTNRTILEFDRVSIPDISPFTGAVEDITFVLHAGEFALINTDETCDRLPLADAAEGLLAPASGMVRFNGENWSAMGDLHCSEMRGHIRRIFDNEGWISNLSLIENVILAECHHTPRPRARLVAEAEARAREVGLAGVPDGRAVGQHPALLRKLEFARAFMGQPDLIIIDRYNLQLPRAEIDRIIAGLRAAAGRGATILWQTCETQVWKHPDLQTMTHRFQMEGTRMVPEKRAGI